MSDFEGALAYGRELRRAWSEMDIAELASALDIGRTFAQTARFLCRDEDEVRQKARAFRLRAKPSHR